MLATRYALEYMGLPEEDIQAMMDYMDFALNPMKYQQQMGGFETLDIEGIYYFINTNAPEYLQQMAEEHLSPYFDEEEMGRFIELAMSQLDGTAEDIPLRFWLMDNTHLGEEEH
jgi:hypothetical protein